MGDDDSGDILDHQDYEGNVFNMADEFGSSKQINMNNINNFDSQSKGMMAGHNFINASHPMRRFNYV